jgi:N-acetylmuramoyl-L-alanine amidase
MKLKVAARAAATVLLVSLCAGMSRADTIVVRGHRVRSPAAFQVVGDEVYAPMLVTLETLGAQYKVTPRAIRITTDDDQEILISRERPEATRSGALHEMPGLPRTHGRSLLLPARAFGSLMACAVRWDEESRTIYLYPWVRRFVLQRLKDRYRLTIGAEFPITYETGELEDPPRLYIDLQDVDLAQIPSELTVEHSYLKGARIHQHSILPYPEGEVVRVVVDLEEWRDYRIKESEDRRRLTVELPLPDAIELPPDVTPVILTGMDFERISSRLAAVKISTYGRPYCTSIRFDDPPVVCVEVANAESLIRDPVLPVEDPYLSEVCVIPVPDKVGAQWVLIPLREEVGHAIETDEGGLRVLLGRFELEELRVVVDAGHGGHDTGAIGRTGLQEKEVNLDIARRVYRRLQAMGVTARMTRVDGNPVRPWARGNYRQQRRELYARCAVANDMGADLFVSIHCNARRSNPMEHRGTETYYRKADSLPFARVMQEEVVKAVGLLDSGVIRHPKSIIVLHGTKCPSVLVEVAYLSHPDDEAQLATPMLRDHAAQGIANGIRRYVEEGGLLPVLAERERQRGRTVTVESRGR